MNVTLNVNILILISLVIIYVFVPSLAKNSSQHILYILYRILVFSSLDIHSINIYIHNTNIVHVYTYICIPYKKYHLLRFTLPITDIPAVNFTVLYSKYSPFLSGSTNMDF